MYKEDLATLPNQTLIPDTAHIEVFLLVYATASTVSDTLGINSLAVLGLDI